MRKLWILAVLTLIFAAPAQAETIQERNVRIFERFQQEVEVGGDHTHLEEWVVPEFLLTSAGIDGIYELLGTPRVRPTKITWEEFRKWDREVFSGVSNHTRKMEAIYGVGDMVIARWTVEGNLTGSLAGIVGRGEPFRLIEVGFVRFDEEGRMTEGWFRMDGATFLHQIGVKRSDIARLAPATCP